ncbi:hypothetical protein HLB44_01810 [Aquincola sp. S2]|uniref:DUF3108 domain-containing protein n=1 Tax=Pseudaquabacterium terrae TaxID=2732868 RepID=A0ABX2EBI3_9BURK|nr:hypothetical protein [Aquabacterium terrae]NRF65712.1 hypothetical protein [Aquabacterium terrae]
MTTALTDAAATLLHTLHEAPDAAGAWVYDGEVFPRGVAAPDTAMLFSYQRRVRETPDGLGASHITRDGRLPGGAPIIVESARMGSDYTLRRFDAVNGQQGFSGSVEVSADGRQLHYRLQRGSRLRESTERIDAPAVSGPSLHGHILAHWDALAAGEVSTVRMIVLAQRTSYAFQIRQDPAAARGRRAFTITPARWWVRLAVAPLRVAFDESTRQVLRYEGRVPPLRAVRGRLKAFDACVNYPRHAAHYR